jgi:GT2 family glycosyltransferase
MSLCVVVVTYNSAGVIERCLRSCQGMKVTVVDNASGDNTLNLVKGTPGVEWIANTDNR